MFEPSSESLYESKESSEEFNYFIDLTFIFIIIL